MFDFTSSKLLILGIVALLVIGPKEFPALLRTLGKYMGIIRRHANDFRAQFDEAMRESELSELKKEMETFQRDTEQSIRAAEQSVQTEMDTAKKDVEQAMTDPAADGLPVASGGGAGAAVAPLNGATRTPDPAIESASAEPAPAAETAGSSAGQQPPEKSGA